MNTPTICPGIQEFDTDLERQLFYKFFDGNHSWGEAYQWGLVVGSSIYTICNYCRTVAVQREETYEIIPQVSVDTNWGN